MNTDHLKLQLDAQDDLIYLRNTLQEHCEKMLQSDDSFHSLGKTEADRSATATSLVQAVFDLVARNVQIQGQDITHLADDTVYEPVDAILKKELETIQDKYDPLVLKFGAMRAAAPHQWRNVQESKLKELEQRYVLNSENSFEGEKSESSDNMKDALMVDRVCAQWQETVHHVQDLYQRVPGLLDKMERAYEFLEEETGQNKTETSVESPARRRVMAAASLPSKSPLRKLRAL